MPSITDDYICALSKWIAGPCSIDIRFVAERTGEAGIFQVLFVQIHFYPLSSGNEEAFNFESRFENFIFGQQILTNVGLENSISVLQGAAAGEVVVYDKRLRLSDVSIGFPEWIETPNEWFNSLGFRIKTSTSHNDALLKCSRHQYQDEALRRATPPFDGLKDLCGWLNFSSLLDLPVPGTIEIRAEAPVDLVFAECTVANGSVTLKLLSHANLDVSDIGLAVRGVPSPGVTGRRQLGGDVQWDSPVDHTRTGSVSVEISGIDSVLVMLSLGDAYVRRQWFTDSIRSRNVRLLSTRYFDHDLKMVQRYLLDEVNQDKFELAVAALAHLSGYSAMVQLEKDSPDLILITPAGQVLIVECTIRTADVPAKVGKLVDRREALRRALSTDGREASVVAVLACQLGHNQIAATQSELAAKGVILASKEELNWQLNTLNAPVNPDAQYARLVQMLEG
ncbi:hypothetical protein [Dyella ginsengisoli]|uniref:hypothetical protein n=1 Tax=Dyella ginsengisoli TaxID=363848 RepID=UPI0012FE4300|nr:hypothetical protein [Dyella ginsengisoli]